MTVIPINEEIVRISISIPKRVLRKVDEYRVQKGWRSRSKLIANALDYYVSPKEEGLQEDEVTKGVLFLTYGIKNEVTPRFIQEKMYKKGSCVQSLRTCMLSEENFFVYGFVEGWISEINELMVSLKQVGGVVDVGFVRVNDEMELMAGLPYVLDEKG